MGEVWRRGWGKSAALAEGGADSTVEVYVSEESEEGESQCYSRGRSSKSESCQEH